MLRRGSWDLVSRLISVFNLFIIMIILKRYLLPYLLSPLILKLGSLRRRMGLYAGIQFGSGVTDGYSCILRKQLPFIISVPILILCFKPKPPDSAPLTLPRVDFEPQIP